jgi:hypothetical protein
MRPPRWFVVFILGVAGLLLAVVFSSHPSQDVPQGAAPTKAPPAYSLAVIQNGGYVGPDDLLVRQFQRQLDLLSSKCNDAESTIADQVVTTHDILKKRGIVESYLAVLTDVDRVVPAGTSMTCAQDFAAWATIRIDTP